jgi:hypothetical protein
MNAMNVISPDRKAAPKLVALGLPPMVLRWKDTIHRPMKTRSHRTATVRRHNRGITKKNKGRWNSEDNMNAMNVISPYKHHGVWVFDDARVGLQQEPFVAGADPRIRDTRNGGGNERFL